MDDTNHPIQLRKDGGGRYAVIRHHSPTLREVLEDDLPPVVAEKRLEAYRKAYDKLIGGR